jgi:hypothetical protein
MNSKDTTISMKCRNISKFGECITEILSLFQSKMIISGYSFDDENFHDMTYISKSILDSVPLNFQIFIQNPATIISFIEQYKLDTFYHPEIIATTLRSLATQFNINLEFEDYLLDNVYRTDNFDVQAQDILYEFRLTDKKSVVKS